MLTLEGREKIAKTFGQSSISYDQNARLQRYSGNVLCQYLAQVGNRQSSQHNYMLDLGCGTGYFTQQLAKRALSGITALDLSPEMLSFAKQRNYATEPDWICGDAHALPLPGNSHDLIFSNLVLQWTKPLTLALKEAYRVLTPGGHMVFSTLIQGTLDELKQAWATVDNDRHVIDYLTAAQVDCAWLQAGFTQVFAHTESVEFPYTDVNHLARELKHLGASLVSDKSQKGLTGKDKWRRMVAAYPQPPACNAGTNTHNSQIHATYQLYTVCLNKPPGD
ncbi:malonyl-ACP O-methyltransferase BioC [Thalassotalea mangrovi]|uniref:malonyl-ACP O-methyltransferase BioC n=1 Tax=Thalassotalea mangrovi TaxID=2572245 RepID=UPI00145F18B3|nr:malonyl-ACP O-methyltransferase BioC [Thalassotalea mangrovi]